MGTVLTLLWLFPKLKLVKKIRKNSNHSIFKHTFRNKQEGDSSMVIMFMIALIATVGYLLVGGSGNHFGSSFNSNRPISSLGNSITWHTTIDVSEGASPRLVKMADGSWLGAFVNFISEKRYEVKIYKSTDDTRSWTYLSTVSDGDRQVDNPILLQLPNGDVLLAGRNLIPRASYRISLWRSSDGGLTWRGPTTVDRNENPGGREGRGLWEPFLYTLPDGRLTILYANETHFDQGYPQVISQRISNNNGESWGQETWAVSKSGGRPGMPVAARMTNGKYMLVYEACLMSPNCAVHYKISEDGSRWGNDLGNAIPDQNCGPWIASLTDGRLVVTSCSNKISYSEDFGATWKDSEAAFPSGAWPAIYEIKSGEVAAVVGDSSRIRIGTVTPR